MRSTSAANEKSSGRSTSEIVPAGGGARELESVLRGWGVHVKQVVMRRGPLSSMLSPAEQEIEKDDLRLFANPH